MPVCRYVCVVVALLATPNVRAFAQKPEREDVYVRSSDAPAAVLKQYDTGTRTCAAAAQTAGGFARIVIQFESTAQTWVVNLTSNNKADGMAAVGTFYCIAERDIQNFFRPSTGPDVGLLAVPFKLHFSPVKVMAGSAVGPFVGKRFGSRDNYGTLLAFAALTNVPVNDLNADVPQTKWGVGGGAGMVWTIRRDFQVGLISGVDLFDGVEKWAYGYQPWVSLSIGFSFLSTNKDPQATTIR